MKISEFFYRKSFICWVIKFSVFLNRHVFVIKRIQAVSNDSGQTARTGKLKQKPNSTRYMQVFQERISLGRFHGFALMKPG